MTVFINSIRKLCQELTYRESVNGHSTLLGSDGDGTSGRIVQQWTPYLWILEAFQLQSVRLEACRIQANSHRPLRPLRSGHYNEGQ